MVLFNEAEIVVDSLPDREGIACRNVSRCLISKLLMIHPSHPVKRCQESFNVFTHISLERKHTYLNVHGL